ncbi:TadE/TadG family type IV pilus assembly protein [Sphingomonas sp. SAFR-052]|uniref:TadE/TadG family type IV pilus assembly protein n=1 Tax=Sphingomonas sp. SAFR-052 TaxID=3436867 RepID=UPI003F7E1D25
MDHEARNSGSGNGASTGGRRACKHFVGDRRGLAVVELALTLPILLMFLFGILSGGCWLAISHVVQESANEGARAALAGLNAPERAALASDAARSVLAGNYGIAQSDVGMQVEDDGRRLTLNVAYDGSANPLMKLPILPASSTMIRRQASVVLNGL